MKFRSLLFLILCSLTANSQVSDSFTDGDFTTNPIWSGTGSNFIVNANEELQLNAIAAGTSYLTTPHGLSSMNNCEWRIKIHQNFSSSSSNYGRIYLTSSSSDLSTNPDGFYLQLGEANSTDAVRLFKSVSGISTQICAGPDGQIASAFTVGIRVVRDNVGLWSLWVDPSGGTNFVNPYTGNDATALLGTWFGIRANYTLSNITKFYFDDIYVGPEIIDIQAPLISNLTIVSSTQLDVLFDQVVAGIEAIDPSNYNLTPTLPFSSATIDGTNGALVHLTLGSNLQNGQNYQLTVFQIEDVLGNDTVNLQTMFNYLVSEIPSLNDLLINELMVDPSPSVDLPDAEYIEIYNNSSKYFDMTGWKLCDNSGFGTVLSGWIMPGEYKLLCSTSSQVYYPSALAVSAFPSFNNTGDKVILRASNGDTIDELDYTDEWYHDDLKKEGGYSLERIYTAFPCLDIDNWKASESITGGTPQNINSVFSQNPDILGPKLLKTSVIDSNSVLLVFSEGIDTLNLVSSVYYSNPILTLSTIDFPFQGSHDVTLNFDQNIESGLPYVFTLDPISDCWSNSSQVTGNFIVSGDAQQGDIIITEIMVDPSPVIALPDVEYVEIYNKSSKGFDLSQWKIGDDSGYGTIISGWIMPGEYKVICTGSSQHYFLNALIASNFPSFGNTGDKVIIQDSLSITIDEIQYTDAWYNDELKKDGGFSIERIHPIDPCSDKDNWSAAISVNGGTPELQNSIYSTEIDNFAPFIIETEVLSPNSIDITFSETMDSSSLANSVITVSPFAEIQSIYVDDQGSKHLKLSFTDDLISSLIYKFTIGTVSDCWMNTTSITSQFSLPEIPLVGDLVINELLFDPSVNGSDFVEIYNTSNKMIDISLLSFANFDNDTIANIHGVTTQRIIKPKEYLVFTEDSVFQINQFPSAFQGSFVKQDLPTLNNDSSSLYLFYDLVVLDKISYSSDWHLSLVEDTENKTLERIDPLAPTDKKDNWHTAAETIGFGTPGLKNSQYNTTTISGVFSTENPIFSPDNDGFQDVLSFFYRMELSGMIANLTIYDDQGRIIKKLLQNEILAVEGNFNWDGTTDTQQKAPIGIYLGLMDTYKKDGSAQFSRKVAFTLGGKL